MNVKPCKIVKCCQPWVLLQSWNFTPLGILPTLPVSLSWLCFLSLVGTEPRVPANKHLALSLDYESHVLNPSPRHLLYGVLWSTEVLGFFVFLISQSFRSYPLKTSQESSARLPLWSIVIHFLSRSGILLWNWPCVYFCGRWGLTFLEFFFLLWLSRWSCLLVTKTFISRFLCSLSRTQISL